MFQLPGRKDFSHLVKSLSNSVFPGSLYLVNICILILLLVFGQRGYSQQFVVDTLFQPNISFTTFGNDATLYGGEVDSLGRIIVYGDHTDPNYIYNSTIVRLESNGLVDLSFSTYPLSLIDYVSKMTEETSGFHYILLNDEEILKLDQFGHPDQNWSTNFISNFNGCFSYLGNRFDPQFNFIGSDSCDLTSNPSYYYNLGRYNPSGLVDTTFHHHPNKYVDIIAPTDSSHVIICGRFTQYDGIPNNLICKIDTSGTLDTTFSCTISGGIIFSCLIQDNGKIILMGKFNLIGYSDTLGIARFNPNGSLDTSFKFQNGMRDGIFPGGCISTIQQKDKGYIISGWFTEYDGKIRNRIAKIDSSGILDLNNFNGSGFDSSYQAGTFSLPIVMSLVPGISNDFFATGYFNRYEGRIIKSIIHFIQNPLAIDNNAEKKYNFSLFPNPTRNELSIKISSNFNEYLGKGSIYNLFGELVVQFDIKSELTNIDISSLSPGCYFLEVSNKEGNIFSKKIIKM